MRKQARRWRRFEHPAASRLQRKTPKRDTGTPRKWNHAASELHDNYEGRENKHASCNTLRQSTTRAKNKEILLGQHMTPQNKIISFLVTSGHTDQRGTAVVRWYNTQCQTYLWKSIHVTKKSHSVQLVVFSTADSSLILLFILFFYFTPYTLSISFLKSQIHKRGETLFNTHVIPSL